MQIFLFRPYSRFTWPVSWTVGIEARGRRLVVRFALLFLLFFLGAVCILLFSSTDPALATVVRRLLIRSVVCPLFFCCLRRTIMICWFWTSAVDVVICCTMAAIVSAVNEAAARGCRKVISSSPSVSAPASAVLSSASAIAIGHNPSSIIFRRALAQAPLVVPGFKGLSGFITAFATVFLSLFESSLIFSPKPRIMDAICSLSASFLLIGALPPTSVLRHPTSDIL